MSPLHRRPDGCGGPAAREFRAPTRNCGSTRNAAPRREISSSQAALQYEQRRHRAEPVTPLTPAMVALLSPFLLLVGPRALRAKRHFGARSLELLLALALAVLFGASYRFFAGVLLCLAPRRPFRRTLLSHPLRRPVPF